MFLAFGIIVMWFLAFFMGFSKPVEPERVEELAKEYF